MVLEVHRLEPARRADFHRLHSEGNQAGWCSCVAWWVPTWQGWGERSAEENRALRERLCREGHHDGYLLYVDGEPAGWCQAGPRDRLEKLVRQFGLEPAPETWALTCFLIAPRHRRQGLVSRLLERVLEDLRARGVWRVEAFPRRGDGLDAPGLWTGPETVFLRQGFEVVRDDPVRPVLALVFD